MWKKMFSRSKKFSRAKASAHNILKTPNNYLNN